MSTLIVQVWTHAGVKSCGACCYSSVFTNYPHHTRHPHCVTITDVTNGGKNVYIRNRKMTLSHVGEMTMNSHFPMLLRSSLCMSPHTISNFLFHYPTVSVTSQESAHLTVARGVRVGTRRSDPKISRQKSWNSLKATESKKKESASERRLLRKTLKANFHFHLCI